MMTKEDFHMVHEVLAQNKCDTFMKWCYSRLKACKEDNGEQCYDNIYFIKTLHYNERFKK
jgi:hypothetical protein